MTPDIATRYLGLNLKNPLIAGSSPMVEDLDRVIQLERAGAAAIVMHSLFEEQIRLDQDATTYHTETHAESFAEALSYFPQLDDFKIGPEDYLRRLKEIKNALTIPVIGSINGVTPGGWTQYAQLMERAGADAIELNFYHVATDSKETGESVEKRLLNVVSEVRAKVSVPLAVKLSPFYSSLPHLVGKLTDAGVNGVILFNRFYQPDIDIDLLETSPRLRLSDSSELLLRLRWIAAIYGKFPVSIALTGGVHEAPDLIKSIMAGADVVQIVSALLLKGPARLAELREDLIAWMADHEYENFSQLRGCMSMKNCPDPTVFERANYMRLIEGWSI